MKLKRMTAKPGLPLLAAAFVVINVVAAFAVGHIRLDLTEKKLNTLSDGTRSILESLDEPVTVQLYLSSRALEPLPSLQGYAKQVEALLEEYRLLSQGNLRIEKIDPLPFSEEEDEAVAAGLQGVPVNGGETLYFGLIAQAAGGRRTIPFFQPEREPFLEYDLSQLIYAASHPQRKVVGILSAVPLQGGPIPGQGMGEANMLIEQLGSQFDVRHLPRGERGIAGDVDILMVVNPHGLDDSDLYAVDQYVLSGGATLVFADPFSEAESPGFGQMPQQNPLADNLLGAWGVRLVSGKLVGDPASAQQVSYRDRTGRSKVIRYLPWFSLGPQNYNADEILVNQLGRVNLASAGALVPVAGSGVEFTPLAQGSPQAGLIDKTLVMSGLDPGQLAGNLSPSDKPPILAARSRGAFATAFPEGAPGDDSAEPGEQGEEPQAEHLDQAAGPVNLLIVADSDLLQDRFWVQVNNFFGQRLAVPRAANLDLVTNALELLGGSPDLISVRSRGSHHRPFELVARIQQQAEERYRAKEQELLQKLEATERKLSELQRQRDDAGSASLTAEQQQEVDKFLQEKVRHRKKLRDVQYQLRADIEDLERTLKILNIGLMPMLITLVAFVTWLVRQGRSRRF